MVGLGLLVGMITGICQVIKGFVPARFMPIASLFLGIVMGVSFVEGPVQSRIFYGVALGLAASGLFDVAKMPLKGKGIM